MILYASLNGELFYVHNRKCLVLRKLNVLEMKCLRGLMGVSRMDGVSNEEVLRAGIEKKFASRVD